MGLESATFINQLVATNPVGATDTKAQGDDHLRLIKSTLQATFPNIAGAMTATHTRLNDVSNGIFQDGASATPGVRFSDADSGFYLAAPNVIAVSAGSATIQSWTTGLTRFQTGIQVQADNGSAAAPIYSFTNNTNLGIYRIGSNTLGISANSLLVAAFTSGATQQAQFADGAVGTPGVAFFNETNSGAYRISANRIGFSANGVLIFDYRNSGLVMNTGQLFVQDGTVGAPGMAFAGEAASGVYRIGAANIGISINGTKRFDLSNTLGAIDVPLLRANGIHNGTAPTGAANQYIASGTYTPTISNTTNVAASSPQPFQWMRVGNVVTVSGEVEIDPTAAALTQFEMSLPIASDLNATTHLRGIAIVNRGPPAVVARVAAAAGTDTAQVQYVDTGTSNADVGIHFTYLVR